MIEHVRHSKVEKDFSENIERRKQSWSSFLDDSLLVVIEELAKQMAAKQMTKSKLADALGTSRSYISQLLSGKPNLRLSSLYKISFAVGLRPRIVFEKVLVDDEMEYQKAFHGSMRMIVESMPRNLQQFETKVVENFNAY